MGLLTVLIFSLGLLLGLFVNESKLNYIQQLSKTQRADYGSLQFQYSYIETLENKDMSDDEKCGVLAATLENNLKMLSPALEKIEAYETSGDVENEDYLLLKREYTIANLRYWILAEKSKKMCMTDTVSVLYFYTKNCPECNDQGYILTQMKKVFEDSLLVFPIDTSINEPAVDVLTRQYNITTYPTLIIEKKRLHEVKDKNELTEIICPLYFNKTKYTLCSGG